MVHHQPSQIETANLDRRPPDIETFTASISMFHAQITEKSAQCFPRSFILLILNACNKRSLVILFDSHFPMFHHIGKLSQFLFQARMNKTWLWKLTGLPPKQSYLKLIPHLFIELQVSTKSCGNLGMMILVELIDQPWLINPGVTFERRFMCLKMFPPTRTLLHTQHGTSTYLNKG